MRSLVEGLCAFAGRGACTDAERRAALWLHDELRARGLEPYVETRWVRPQRWAVLAIGGLLGVVGSLLAVPTPVAGLVVAGVGALSLTVEALGWIGPVRLPFPRRATQDVLTEVPDGAIQHVPRAVPAGPTQHEPKAVPQGTTQHVPTAVPPGATQHVPRAVPDGATQDVPTAVPDGATQHVPRAVPDGATQDVPTAVPPGATQDVPTAVPDVGVPLVIAAAYDAPGRGLVLDERWRALLRPAPRGSLAVCGVLVAAAAAARVAGVEDTWLGAVQLLPTVVLLVAFAAAADVALSGWAPGANDNASGVAVALAAFEELQREPPRLLVPALLFVGAGHAVHRIGLPEGAVLVELGPCGAGRPVVRARHPVARAAAARAAEALGATIGGDPPAGAGVRIACLDERGIVPRAHQEDDTVVDEAAMEAALDLALGVVDALDSELPRQARRTSTAAG